MSLDLHIKYGDKIFQFDISESLHHSIFSDSTKWSGFKRLRKIKDYYRADCIFKNDDANLFIEEFINICEGNSLAGNITREIKKTINGNKLEYVRVSSD